MKKIKVCLWATTLQANIYTFARYLAERDECEVVVVTEDVDGYKNEPINLLAPINAPILDKNDSATDKFLKEFNADVTVVDNHYPKKKISDNIVVLWHGFGWKGPENRKDFDSVFSEVKKLTGISPDSPNSKFRWICAGATNFNHRKNVTEIAEENLVVAGQPYYDDILNPPFDKNRALDFYPESFKGRKIALVAFTWHYGNVFSHWGDDIAIFESLFDRCNRLNISIILRMHDKKRFDKKYLKSLEDLADKYGNVFFKYKDIDRDNLMDIVVSDFMISNFSSMITYYYPTMKPSIHIYPVDDSKDKTVYRVWKNGKVREKKAEADYIWSLPSEENGGIVVKSLEELLSSVKLSIENPDCCKDRSNYFIDKHLAPVDGKNCKRIADVMKDFVLKP